MLKKFLAFLTLVLGLALPASAGELQTALAFNTGPFLCSAGPSAAVYWNNSGAPMHIRQAVVWLGMDKGARGDFAAKVKVNSTQTVLAFTNWDHYDEPDGLHNLTMNYEPNYILLNSGDALVLEYDCTVITGTPTGLHGNVVVYLWWTDQP